MIACGGSRSLLTRLPSDASPDKNREWAGSGIDRSGGRPVTFALPTAVGSLAIDLPDLLLRSTGGARTCVHDPKEERGW